MDETVGSETGKKPGAWLRALKTIFCVLAYTFPLFWLWNRTGYPDSLGVHITAHGKCGLIEHWWYSYLLLERHRPWDVVLFVYTWAPVAGFIGWMIWSIRREPADAIQDEAAL